MHRIQFGQCVTMDQKLIKSKEFLALRRALRSAWNELSESNGGQATRALPCKVLVASALEAVVNWAIAKPRYVTNERAAHEITKVANLPYFAWAMYSTGWLKDRENHLAISLEGWLVVPDEPNEFAKEEKGDSQEGGK